MLSLPVLIDDGIQTDFGSQELAAVRAVMAKHDHAGATLAQQVHDRLAALATVQRKSNGEMYQWFGRQLAGPLVAGLPGVFKGHSSTRSVVVDIATIGPKTVAALELDLVCPDLWTDLLDADTMRIGFDGPEVMAQLIDGVVSGLGVYFGDRVTVGRGTPPATLTERRLVDVKVLPDRRSGGGTPPNSGERRGGILAGLTSGRR